MKKGQGWAKRVTLENLSSFAPFLRRADVAEERRKKFAEEQKQKIAKTHAPSPFKGEPLTFANRFSPPERKAGPRKRQPTSTKPASGGTVSGKRGFLMTLQNTDVGVGQTSAGTSRRSPEIFIPKICVRSEPDFWGWPDLFKPDPKWKKGVDSEGFGKMDRDGVRMQFGSQVLRVNWWYNPDKKDYRLRNESLRSAGRVGDILRIEKAGEKAGFDYEVEVIPQGTPQFEKYIAICTN